MTTKRRRAALKAWTSPIRRAGRFRKRTTLERRGTTFLWDTARVLSSLTFVVIAGRLR